MWERKKGNGRGEKRDDERERKQEKREKGKMERKSETGRLSKLLGPQGICVVSYQACRGMTTMIHTHTHTHTHRGGRPGHGRKGHEQKPQRPGWQGRGGRAALGSYRQSGGANSTRKTWGALVGETGRSHLTSTVTPGHDLGLRAHGGRKSRGYYQGS